MKISLILFALLLTKFSFGFVITKSESEQKLSWRKSTVEVFINPSLSNQSNSNLTESQAYSIIERAFSKWKPHFSGKNISLFPDDSLYSNPSTNKVKFSSNPAYFGSGVLAVTRVNHSARTGEIYNASILINDSFSTQNKFVSNESGTEDNKVYLGDVLSHEVGHFLGLGHSDVPESTMVYSVFKGQLTPHSDDIAGLNDLYSSNQGASISGRVAGGSDIGIFGAQVQAISVKTGKVASGVLSEEDGSFKINNLDTSDSFLIYVLPPRDINHLPSYYASVQTKYCNSKSYVPSFFQKCGGRNKSYPQVIKPNSEIGTVSIRCDENLNTEYLLNKTKSVRNTFSVDMREGPQVFTGYFSNDEISNNITNLKDELEIDLSNLQINPADYVLDIQILTSEIGSNFSAVSRLTSNGGINSLDFPSFNSLGRINPNNNHSVSLSPNPSLNMFTLLIDPYETARSSANELFANIDVMANENSTYAVIINLKKVNNSGIFETFTKNSAPYSDNNLCLESNITRQTNANSSVVSSGNFGENDEAPQAMTCGTIDIDDNGGSGGGFMSFILGILFMSLTAFSQRKSFDFFV